MLSRDGFQALPKLRQRHGGGEVFTTSMLGRRTVVVKGRQGARLFYDTSVVHRAGGVPGAIANLLFGRGAVHGLDGAEHATRKRMFLDILTADRVDRLSQTIGATLRHRISEWPGREVVIFDELVEVYGGAVQTWAGIPGDDADLVAASRRLAIVVAGFGGARRTYARAWAARLWVDRWATGLIAAVRDGSLQVDPDSPLAQIAVGSGASLSARVAGVELLNILRPTVAVAWHGTFVARALAESVDRARELDPMSMGNEIRRTCPFTPALAGRVHSPAHLAGVDLVPGDRIVLDVPATNTDEEYWSDPHTFDPDRFVGLMPDPFAFVTQGGGDTRTGHRCPGEHLTAHILEQTAAALREVDLTPVGDTSFDPTQVPTLPKGGLPVRVTRQVVLPDAGQDGSPDPLDIREPTLSPGTTQNG